MAFAGQSQSRSQVRSTSEKARSKSPTSWSRARTNLPRVSVGSQRMSAAREEEEDAEGEDELSEAETEISKRRMDIHDGGHERASKRSRHSPSGQAGSGEESDNWADLGDEASQQQSVQTSNAPSSSSTAPNTQERAGWQTSTRPAADDSSSARRGQSSSSSMYITIPPKTSPLKDSQALTTPPIAGSSSQVGLKTQAVFVGKLYAMLEDETIQKSGLIGWSADGTVFSCLNPTEFSKVVLPQYFKHNNWQSFVRQLNMYGFNKVNDLFHASSTDPQAWEFRHPNFRRGEPQLLASIKRKSTRGATSGGNPQTPPFAAQQVRPAVPGSPKGDYFQSEAANEEGWTSEPPRRQASSPVVATAPVALPCVVVETPMEVKSTRPPASHRAGSVSRPFTSFTRDMDPPRDPSRAWASAGPLAPSAPPPPMAHAEHQHRTVSPRPPPVFQEPRRGMSSHSSTWSGTGTSSRGSTSTDQSALQIAILEAQLKSTMRKLHRERLDNRASSLGVVTIVSRLIGVIYGETRVPQTQAQLRDIAEILTKQQLELEHNYQHLASIDQYHEWDLLATRVRADMQAAAPPPPVPAAPAAEFYPSQQQHHHRRRDRPYRSDASSLPAFAAQGLPPLNLDPSQSRERDRSPGTGAGGEAGLPEGPPAGRSALSDILNR